MSNPKRVRLPAFTVAGLPLRTTNESAMVKIPKHWERFFAEGHHERIPKVSEKLLGVYTDYESDHRGAYTLIPGFETGLTDSLPDGLVAVAIPEQEYLIFHGEGKMPGIVMETWGRALAYFDGNEEQKRTYTTDFELYPNENEVEIYIAVLGDE